MQTPWLQVEASANERAAKIAEALRIAFRSVIRPEMAEVVVFSALSAIFAQQPNAL